MIFYGYVFGKRRALIAAHLVNKKGTMGESKEVATKASLTPLSNHVNNGKGRITLPTVSFGHKITQWKWKLLFIYFLDLYQPISISFEWWSILFLSICQIAKSAKHFCLLYLVGNHFDPILYYSLTPLRKIYLCLLLDGNILTKTIFVCFWTYKESRHFCGNDLEQIWLDVFCTLKVFFAFQSFLTILVAQRRLCIKGL